MKFRLKLLAVIGTGALLVLGFISLIEGMKFSSVRELTYDQFVQQRPQEGWFRITGGAIDLQGALYRKTNSSYDKKHLYIPLYNPNKDERECYVMVETEDPDIASQAESATEGQAGSSSASQARVVEGMLATGLHADSKMRSLIAQKSDVATDYVILEEGRKPSALKGLGLLAMGVLLAVAQVLYYRSNWHN